MANITKEEISDILVDFYQKFMDPEFKAIRIKLDEYDQKFKDLIDRLEDLEKRLDFP
jgi:hypothetical protein